MNNLKINIFKLSQKWGSLPVHYDSLGTELASYCFGKSDGVGETANTLVPDGDIHVLGAEDGGCYIFTYFNSDTTGGNAPDGKGGDDIWLIKFNADGSPAWNKVIGGNGDDHPVFVKKHPDGGIIVLAETTSVNQDAAENIYQQTDWLMYLDVEGDILNNIFFTRNVFHLNEVFINDIYYYENIFRAVGSAIWLSEDYKPEGHLNTSPGDDAFVVPIESSDTLNQKTSFHYLGGTKSERIEKVMKFNEDDIITFGKTSSSDSDLVGFSPRNGDIWVAQLNAGGEILNQTIFDDESSTDGYEFFYDAIKTSTGDFLILEESGGDFALFKISATPTGISEKKKPSYSFQLYPNPNHTGVLHSSISANYTLLNMQGQRVKEYHQQKDLDVSGLEKGMYVLRNEYGQSLKLILE